MATRTTKAAAPPPDPAPQATAVRSKRAAWVVDPATPGAGGKMGYVPMVKADRDAAIAAGQAIDPFKQHSHWPYRQGHEPQGYPPIDPTPTIAITAISAANPAVATASAADVKKLTDAKSTKVKISGATGTDAATINATFAIGAKTATTFVLTGLDNSAPLVFGGFPLTAQGSK